MTEQHEALKADSSAVMKHVDMYQGLINRMAGNSADCKKWAIGLVSAILLLVADKGKIEFAWLAWIPAVLFCFLDAYYLALEKQFRNAYGVFIQKLHSGNLHSEELYRVRVDGKLPKTFLEALLSWAVWPFYLAMLLIIVGAKWGGMLHISGSIQGLG